MGPLSKRMFRRSPYGFQRTSRATRLFAIAAILLGHSVIFILFNVPSSRFDFDENGQDVRSIVTLRLLPLSPMPNQETPGNQKETMRFPAVAALQNKSIERAVKSTAKEADKTPFEPNSPLLESVEVAGGAKISSLPPSLNLVLSKEYLAQEHAKHAIILDERILSGTRYRAEQLAKAFGSPTEYREVRLSEDRIRVYSRFGCFELYQSSTPKHTDPFGRSQEYVSRCND